MRVKSLITGFELTEGKIYEILFEYDTVYELKCDNGRVYCRNKDFFSIVDEIDIIGIDLAKGKDYTVYAYYNTDGKLVSVEGRK